jgi:hypothetical protein
MIIWRSAVDAGLICARPSVMTPNASCHEGGADEILFIAIKLFGP